MESQVPTGSVVISDTPEQLVEKCAQRLKARYVHVMHFSAYLRFIMFYVLAYTLSKKRNSSLVKIFL